MLKNKHNFFVLSIALSFLLFILIPTGKAFASLEITEIMYSFNGSDTLNSKSREWIEIYNPDAVAVDITKIKLYEADTSHGISAESGTELLNPQSYAVIADTPANFLIDNPNYSGIIFDSIFSLSNTGESLELRNASGTILNSAAYNSSMGADGDGNSLQKINNIWKASTPTPGIQNIFVDTGATTTSDSSNNVGPLSLTTATSTPSQDAQTTKVVTKTVYLSAHSSPEELSNYKEKDLFETTAGRDRMASVGAPVEFNAKYSLVHKDECIPAFKWSFGDGFGGNGINTTHTYRYAGEYQIVLKSDCGSHISISRTKVKVILPDLSIKHLSNGDTEVANNGKTEVNIGNWKIGGGQKDFIFPEDTIIGANSKIILSKEDLVSGTSTEKVLLLNPSNREVASYYNKVEKQNSNLSQAENGANVVSISDNNISVTEAERLVLEYKKILALNYEKIGNIENKEIVREDSQDNEDTAMTASVLEAVGSISGTGFWSRLINTPINSIKSFARIFYNF